MTKSTTEIGTAELARLRNIAEKASAIVDIWERSRVAQEAGRTNRDAAPLSNAPPRWEETSAKHALVKAVRNGV